MSAHKHVRHHLYRQIIFVIVIALGLSSLVIVPHNPVQAQSSACVQTHTVQPGENLFRIALANGMSYPALAALNGITNPNLIYVGQVLCLSGSLPVVAPALSLTLTPFPAVFAVPTATPASTDPCFTTQVQTVQIASEIFYSPDRNSRTGTFLQPGSKFLVCTNNTNPSWTLFMLDGVFPLWVPVGVFG